MFSKTFQCTGSLLTSHVGSKTAEGEHHMFQKEGQRTLIWFHLFLTREKWRDLTPIIAHLDAWNQKREVDLFQEVALELLWICPRTFYGIKTVKKFYRPAREAITSSILLRLVLRLSHFPPAASRYNILCLSRGDFHSAFTSVLQKQSCKPVCLQF